VIQSLVIRFTHPHRRKTCFRIGNESILRINLKGNVNANALRHTPGISQPFLHPEKNNVRIAGQIPRNMKHFEKPSASSMHTTGKLHGVSPFQTPSILFIEIRKKVRHKEDETGKSFNSLY
ncbi:MAG: hypothetical protein FGF48_11145, partial [Candidatus Brockarchaeota archaeon]|nr:hypothetical protein [Candidatus Brockarchaeota archaeon]